MVTATSPARRVTSWGTEIQEKTIKKKKFKTKQDEVISIFYYAKHSLIHFKAKQLTHFLSNIFSLKKTFYFIILIHSLLYVLY